MKNKLAIMLAVVGLTFLAPNTSSSGTNKDTVVLSKDNLIVLNQEVSGESVAAVIKAARELDGKFINKIGPKKPLYLFLNTPGGSIQAGLELIEALQGIGRPVHTVTLFAASMGFQIVQNMGDRLILKNGVLMSHRARGEFSGEFGGQSPSQLDSRYGLWLQRIKEMDEQTVKRTNGKQTLESYQKQYASEMWPTGTQSVKQGYADRITLVKCESSLDGVTTNKINFFGIEISYDLDNCPINTSPMNIHVKLPGVGVALPPEKVAEMKAKFLEQYEKKQKAVVPMYW